MVLLVQQCRGKQGSKKPLLQQLMVCTQLCDLLSTEMSQEHRYNTAIFIMSQLECSDHNFSFY